ncbi:MULTISPECIES: hypothetical protein [unclassified Halomonas]|uniref:hypothetical protein n=1 Tax=unclassified Halomonas TaxID=2609666 RepID=UPI001C93AF88|nr:MULTISPECIES: hypothetical protein [unclassified Halomonas]MBY5925215.1 hypothetical protein [Halomonas sp. DP4Y7-2]MBY6232256.1 hypothetical protein [Halomonas sp. DP4Y7-1]
MIIEVQETKTISKNDRTFVVGTYWLHNGKDLYPTKAEGIFDKEYKPGKYELDFEASVYVNRQGRLTLGSLNLSQGE